VRNSHLQQEISKNKRIEQQFELTKAMSILTTKPKSEQAYKIFS
jgi:hypothetical protein